MANHTKSLQLLRDGFKEQFALYVFESEEFSDLLMELSADFVDANIPIVDDDIRLELAMMMMESLKLGNY